MPNSRTIAGARASNEPHHGEAPAGWHVVRKPDPQSAGSRLKRQPHRDLSTLRTRPTAIPARPATRTHNQADTCAPTRPRAFCSAGLQDAFELGEGRDLGLHGLSHHGSHESLEPAELHGE